MTVRILGIGCSPREGSNSRRLIDLGLDWLRERHGGDVETRALDLKDFRIDACRACDVCGKAKDGDRYLDCVVHDEAGKVLESMVWSHGMLVATPVYFGLPSDLFSKFIMRTRLLRHQDFRLANRSVAILATAGRRSGGAETAILSSWLPFIRNGCLIVGNGDRTCQFGTMAWAGGRGHVMSDEWGIEQARDTAERVYQVARWVQAGIESTGQGNTMKFCYRSGTRP